MLTDTVQYNANPAASVDFCLISCYAKIEELCRDK